MRADLQPGERLGPYEIVARLGEGGMGVVYRARDTRLDRPVAIKVVAPEREGDARAPEARERFRREAKAIAQLQHPNVCTLHDVGEHEGADFLVMELLDGETLADRLARGPLAGNEIPVFGAAVASALAAAHRKGILHRDLKPGNILLTRSGPKLLDFGLATLRETIAAPVADQRTRGVSALTGEGTLLGTLAYMAPEQLEGATADERSDLWAVGCVLYEAATGARAFPAATPASTIAAILEREPRPMAEIAPLAPKSLDRLVRACLAKNREARWSSAADLARELSWIADAGDEPGESAARQRPPWKRFALASAALAALALVALTVTLRRSGATSPAGASGRGAVRSILSVAQPGAIPFTSVAAISPDGRRVVVSGIASSGSVPLQLLALDSEQARPLAGTEGAAFAFWSPDSKSLAYFQGKRLKRLDLATGGDSRELCSYDDQPRGGAWSPNGTILFSGSRRGPLQRVSADGGTPVEATELDTSRGEQTHRWPQFLPDGEHFLYWATDNETEASSAIRTGALDESPSAILVEGVTNGIHSAGHLLYATWSQGLVAQPFDWRTGKLSGARRSISTEVFVGMGVSYLPVTASATGDLLFLSKPSTWSTGIGWYDRSGRLTGTLGDLAPWSNARISPDGRRVAACLTDVKTERFRTDLWLFDVATAERTRLTFEEGDVSDPAWSPDGKRLAYVHEDALQTSIRVRAATGGTEKQLLSEAALDNASLDWSPDGTTIAFQTFESSKGNYDLRALDVASGKWRELEASEADEESPRFSPDGNFLAYESNESGGSQVFVRRLADGEKWQISVDGGSLPRFARGGREILFIGADHRLRTVSVAGGGGGELAFGPPRLAPDSRPFPVTRYFFIEVDDAGERLLADAPSAENLDGKFRLIADWAELMKP